MKRIKKWYYRNRADHYTNRYNDLMMEGYMVEAYQLMPYIFYYEELLEELDN